MFIDNTTHEEAPVRHWIDFAAVKAAAQFEPILMRYELGLEKQGRELVGRCPFHEDDKPSFSVNPTKNVFHCFGCGAKGNLLDFVAKMEDVPIRKAAEMVAEWLGIEGVAHVPARTLQRRRGLRRKASSEARPAHVDAIARDGEGNDGSSVADSNQALAFALKLDASHSYLAERGVDAETARHFGVGFCERGMFGGRIAIPIHNAAGELVGYLGRWPGETLPGGEKRYKLPPAFKKNDVLYNLHRVRGTEHVVIVEGAWSVFRLHALGYSAVALLGCSLSERQEALLSDLGATRVSVLLDGDQAGRAAAMEIVRRISRHGFVRLLDLPDGAQPDTVDEGVLARLLA